MIIDWKKTCEKCMDGEVEPMHCEYYGEPNGCNSPTYGEHPPTGNAAAMRYALEAFVEYSELVCRMGMFNRDRLVAITTKALAALAAPPRSCDVLSADQFKKIWEHEMRIYMPKEATDIDRHNARIVAYGVTDALFAEHKGENNGK